MTSKGRDETTGEGRDAVWPGEVQWSLGIGGQHMNDVLWRCDALRAGKLYQRSLFGTHEEAEQFALRMRQTEPDQMFNVEAIKASSVWS
jgi:hypothetical protein